MHSALQVVAPARPSVANCTDGADGPIKPASHPARQLVQRPLPPLPPPPRGILSSQTDKERKGRLELGFGQHNLVKVAVEKLTS